MEHPQETAPSTAGLTSFHLSIIALVPSLPDVVKTIDL